MKKKASTDIITTPPKKSKLNEKTPKTDNQKSDKYEASPSKGKFQKTDKKPKPITDFKAKKFQKGNAKDPKKLAEKPEDWNKFKKEKKDLKLKRKQSKGNFEIVSRAKSIGEKLRRKTLKGGNEERNKLINDLHNLLKGKGEYAKFVLAHDTARIVQWLLKYSSDIVVQQISKVINCLKYMHHIHCIF